MITYQPVQKTHTIIEEETLSNLVSLLILGRNDMARRPSDAKLEADFQAAFIKRLRKAFDRVIILKNDSGYLQGIMDLTVILPGVIVFIEAKPYEDAPYEPNQEYYLDLVQRFGFFSCTLFPENEEEVFRAIHSAVRAAS